MNVWANVNDPMNEVDTFQVWWFKNNIRQLDIAFVLDSVKWQDTIRVEIRDTAITADLICLDSIYIADEDNPHFMIYSGYQRPSHACIGTGRTKLQVPTGYTMTNVWIDDPNALLNDGNHVIVDRVTGGNHTFSYYINTCKYYEELFIETKPRADLEINQLYLATCNDGKFNIMLSDSMIIDSILVNNQEMLIVSDTIYHLHIGGGNNEIIVYSENCEWYQSFFVESEELNILAIENIALPHQGLSTGKITISSKKEAKEAIYVFENLETDVPVNGNTVLFDYLESGDYIFKIKDKNGCWSEIDYILDVLTGNPVPTGFSSDSIFNFSIDGIAIDDIQEIGNQYNLIIMRQLGNMSYQEVFNTNNGDRLPWNKEFNGQAQYGYFLYNLSITNANYTGENPIKAYFRIYKSKN